MNPRPSLKIFALGGCGINIVNSCKMPDGVITLMDTSYANVKEGQEVTTLSRKNEGGGKIRSMNATEIDENIKALDDIYADINVLLYSTSGASGSVIGPLMNKYINSYGKKVINCAVISDDSEKEIQNTLNTIKSLDSIAKRENIFMPIVLFHNTNKYTQKELNTSIVSYIIDIHNLFTISVSEIDKNDRLNFLSDDEGGSGLRPMNLTRTEPNEKHKKILKDIVICNSISNKKDEVILLHSYMGIGYIKKDTGEHIYPIPDLDNGKNIDISIKTKYEGVRSLEDSISFISVIFPTDMLLKNLVHDLGTKLLKFNNLKDKNKESLFGDENVSSSTGLVL